MNLEQFKNAAGVSSELAARWFPYIDKAMSAFNIIQPVDQAMFIAQMGHESTGYSRVVESFNYSPEGLTNTFKKHRITPECAAKIGRTATHPANQQAIANQIYGGAWGRDNLGNTEPGDGWKYRGRGLPQITGRRNYKRCGEALGLDLINYPELLEIDEYAAMSAAWFYSSSGCLNYSGNVARITRIINGGENGLKDRQSRFEKALGVLVK